MTEQQSWWSQVKLDPAIAKHIVLSPADIHRITIEAAQAPDPVEKIREILVERAGAKIAALAVHKVERMAGDIRKLKDPDSWPGQTIFLKTQPWVTENGGMRFARMNRFAMLIVVPSDGSDHITYSSLEELVQTWSVD